ncbi:hypothetical protein CR513_56604, partial [Mucuna pruriens]
MSHEHQRQEPDKIPELGMVIKIPSKLAQLKENSLPQTPSKSALMQIATIGQDGDLPPKPLIVRYNPIPQPKTPLIIQVPTRLAYRDNYAIPWQYSIIETTPTGQEEACPTKEVTNIIEAGRMIRSRRVYALETLRKKEPTPEGKSEMIENMKDIVTRKDAAEFLEFIHRNKYELLDQMSKYLTRISLLSLLMNSKGHRNLLLNILKEAHVARDITIEKFGAIINNIIAGSCLSFLEEEVPAIERGHNQPLHISVKHEDYMITRVLIDNGFSLNVLLKTMLDRLCSTSSQLRTSFVIVRAFDGSKREVMGEITLPIRIGPITFNITL